METRVQILWVAAEVTEILELVGFFQKVLVVEATIVDQWDRLVRVVIYHWSEHTIVVVFTHVLEDTHIEGWLLWLDALRGVFFEIFILVHEALGVYELHSILLLKCGSARCLHWSIFVFGDNHFATRKPHIACRAVLVDAVFHFKVGLLWHFEFLYFQKRSELLSFWARSLVWMLGWWGGMSLLTLPATLCGGRWRRVLLYSLAPLLLFEDFSDCVVIIIGLQFFLLLV